MVAYIKNHIRMIYRLNFEEFIIFRRIRLIKYQQMKKKATNHPNKQINQNQIQLFIKHGFERTLDIDSETPPESIDTGEMVVCSSC